MKRLFALFVFACALAFSAPAHAEKQKLYIYTWDTYADSDLFKKFEKETGIEVITDIYSSNDTLMAKLKAGGAYDVVAPSGNYIPLLAQEKLLMPMPEDMKKFADGLTDNIRHPAYDPDQTYSLPLFFGTTGLAVNTKLVKEDVTSWKQFFTRPAGEDARLGVLDDVGTVMDIASIAGGHEYCDGSPDTLKALLAMLKAQKPFVKVYGATGYSERLAANEIALQMAWSGDVYRVRQDNPAIKYVYPKEGVEVWVDNLAIPAAAKNVEAAKKFIAFVMKPENMAAYAQYSGNVPSLKTAMPLLPEKFRDAPEFNIPKGVKGEISRTCPAEVNRDYQKVWDRLLR
ncbi:MAG: extracellular solute-binding protein [Alphaproteobacteria bacterium]|nr:extracellular solute-binding protein [Alphaproteobacteria bacterium]